MDREIMVQEVEAAAVQSDMNHLQPINAEFRDGKIWVALADGRTIGAPIAWYPFLQLATPEQREAFELHFDGVHFPFLDDGISVESMLKGNKPPYRTWEQWRKQIACANE